MKKLLRSEGGVGMIMILAFMALAIPLITSGLALGSALSHDSQVKMRNARAQYAALGVAEYVRYLVSDPDIWEEWQDTNGDQGSIALDGQVINFTASGSEESFITIDSIWQDEPVGALADGSGIGTDTALIRSERAGSGDGRMYHIGFTATPASGSVTLCSEAFRNATGCLSIPVTNQPDLDCAGATPSTETIWSPNGQMTPITVLGVSSLHQCSGEVLVGVSHDGSSVPVDGGPLYDSTQP